MPTVDVRDCATAHLEACLRDEADGKRFILCAEAKWFTELGEYLHAKYGKDYTSVTHTQISKFLMWLVSFCDSQAAMMYKLWGMEAKMDNSATREVLGVDFIPMEKSLDDMVPALIETGYLEDRTKK